MRRKTRPSTISLVEAPKPSSPSSIQTLAVQAIEARPKLQAAIEEQKQKLEEAALELARTFARQTQTANTIDVEKAVQSNQAWKQSEERTRLRIEALENILKKMDDHLDRLKTDSPEAVHAALTLRVETLEKELLEKKTAGEGYAEELKKLKLEISKLAKNTGKKTGDY